MVQYNIRIEEETGTNNYHQTQQRVLPYTHINTSALTLSDKGGLIVAVVGIHSAFATLNHPPGVNRYQDKATTPLYRRQMVSIKLPHPTSS